MQNDCWNGGQCLLAIYLDSFGYNPKVVHETFLNCIHSDDTGFLIKKKEKNLLYMHMYM